MRVFGVVVTALALSSSALAQPAPQGPAGINPTTAPVMTPAEELFLEGRALLDEGRNDEACAKFEASIRLDPDAAGTLLNIGLCHERLGKTATALGWFRRAQFRAAEMGMTDYENVAKNHTFMLAVRVPTLKIIVDTTPTGSAVFVDDTEIKDVDLGKVEVDPGTHTIDFRVPGRETLKRQISIKDGEQLDVTLTPPTPAPVAPPPVVTTTITVEVDRGAPRRRLAYILGGAGLALWGGSLAVTLVAKGNQDASEHPEDLRDAQRLARFGGTGLFIAGSAAIAGAVYFYLKAPGVERVERTVLAPAIGNDSAGLVVHGRF